MVTKKLFFSPQIQKSGHQNGVHKNFLVNHKSKDEVIEFVSNQCFKHSNFLLVNNQKSTEDLH